MEITLSLPKHEFTDTPTKSQLDYALADIITFLNRVGGAYLANSEYTLTDAGINAMFNAAVHLKAAKDQFSSNTAGLAVPRVGGPQPVPGR